MISKDLYSLVLLFHIYCLCSIHLGQCTHLKIYLAIKLLTPLNLFTKEVSPLF